MKLEIPYYKIAQKVNPGEVLPRFYGVAYWEYHRAYLIAYPVPINLIVRFGRWLWHELVRHRPTKFDELLKSAYQAGRQSVQGDATNETP